MPCGRLCLLLLSLSVAALSVDVPLARVLARGAPRTGIHQLLANFEPFGQPTCVLAIALAVALCGGQRLWAGLSIALAGLGSGLAADGVKLLVARVRPHHFDLRGTVAETFVGWLPSWSTGASLRSLPSGHTAVAVGLALALAAWFPRARWLFAILAAMVAAQRVEAGAHYLSDTLCGAALACAVCGVIFRPGRLMAGGPWAAAELRKPLAQVCSPGEGPSAAGAEEASSSAMDAEDSLGRAGRPPRPIARATASEAAPGEPWRHGVRPRPISGLSIIVPVRDERENLSRLHAELAAMKARLPIRQILFVDDGSRDGSERLLQQIAAADRAVEVLHLPQRLGQASALRAGCLRARAEAIAWLDGDLQNDPADLEPLVDRLNAGFDLVCGWRVHRQDRWLDRRLPSLAANALIRRVTRSSVHDMGCTLKVMRAPLARALPLFDGMHRFVPVLAAALGARICEVPVSHRPRVAGRSKYGLGRVLHVLRDLALVRAYCVCLQRQAQADLRLGDKWTAAAGAREAPRAA